MNLFHTALYVWYATHGRKDLPWRNTADAYAILVSEIMLQQTQVKTVLERYYAPFLARFPSLGHLAAAPREEVLKAWQGLGYYTRAANLHKTAQRGPLPRTVEELRALPGIGRNTAHAVAAFAYHQPVAVMEANVKRILHRVFALEGASEAELWRYAAELLDHNDPFTYNQAMMDIGAMVCTKQKPQCLLCPLQSLCKGKDSPLAFPVAKPKKATPVRQRNIVVYTALREGKPHYYVTPRESRFLQGLFGFKEYARNKPVIFYNRQHNLAEATKLGSIVQVYSHFRLEAEVYQIPLHMMEGAENWKSLEEVVALPLSKADEKVVGLIA